MPDQTASLTALLKPTTSPLVLGASIPLRFTLANASQNPVTFRMFKAAAIPAELQWQHSLDAYQLSVLIAHSLIRICVTNSSGDQAVNCGPTPWINPMFAKETLSPGEAFGLDFDLVEFFEIDSADQYLVEVGFSDGPIAAAASTDIDVLRREGLTP
jgi:hypothetical protein